VADWDKMMKINVAAPMRLIRLLAPKMKEKVGWL
jgi:NAD(P)-dependent dehydrogenase (short-subunit alcohol dehydrogenase family)